MPLDSKSRKSGRFTKKFHDQDPLGSLLEGDSSVPKDTKKNLVQLFGMIEREFEVIYTENAFLHEKVEILTEKLDSILSGNSKPEEVDGETVGQTQGPIHNERNKGSTKKSASSQISQRIKSTYKSQTNKFVSSFKNYSYIINQIKEVKGHRDGVWEVTCNPSFPNLFATASADHTACLWSASSSSSFSSSFSCRVQYNGHVGSVNSIRFHPSLPEIVLTSSGDGKVHIWRSPLPLSHIIDSCSNKFKGSSEEDLNRSVEKDENEEEKSEIVQIGQPEMELSGHMGVVIGADWLRDGSQVVSASWDRTAILYDVSTCTVISVLTGHDQELTNLTTHQNHHLCLTSSKDLTFRLWDFRDPSLKVNVFQGHTRSVTSALFSSGDNIISSSDDRTVKVWDLKNLRSPTTTIRVDSGVNRLSVSSSNLLIVPLDNGHIRLYDLHGNRQGRMGKDNKGHTHMVTSASWNEGYSSSSSSSSSTFPSISNLLTSGFDRKIIGWNVKQHMDK